MDVDRTILAKSSGLAGEGQPVSIPETESVPVRSQVRPAPDAEEVKQFCELHGILEHLATAKGLIQECFGPTNLTDEMTNDSESDDEWVVLRVDVRGTQESVLAAKKCYTARWVASVPWPQRHLIRLSYNIV